jgi:hypothetical protein
MSGRRPVSTMAVCLDAHAPHGRFLRSRGVTRRRNFNTPCELDAQLLWLWFVFQVHGMTV